MIKRDSLTQAFRNGWADRYQFGLLRVEQLYADPLRGSRAAWRVGWDLAHVLCLIMGRPLRNSRRRSHGSHPLPHVTPTVDEVNAYIDGHGSGPAYDPLARGRRRNRIIAAVLLVLALFCARWVVRHP
jgi:hypothetical protein